MLARATWPMRAPRAAIVLWQSIALAAVLSAFSAGIAIASRLFVPGADGRPTATITSEIDALGWPLWAGLVTVFAVTLVIGARLTYAVIQVAIATRRRRAHHRMMVDLLDMSHGSNPPKVCIKASGLRILDVKQPLAYCLPGVRSRVVVSEGTLKSLSDSKSPRYHTNAPICGPSRPVDVHRGARAFPDSSAAEARLMPSGCSSKCWPTTPPRAPRVRLLWRALVACRTPARRPGGRRSDHLAAPAPPRRAAKQPRLAATAYPRRRRARGAYPGAGGAVADRITPTVRRIGAQLSKPLPHNKKTKGRPYELVCKL